MKNFKLHTEAFFIDFIARYLWTFFRFFIGRKLSRRCKTCILSEKYRPLNEHGICPDCQNYLKNSPDHLPDDLQNKSEKLNQLLKEHENKGQRWDVLLLFSGGKDSTFLLHRLLHEYKNLRILAVLVDTGFMSPIAITNAESVIQKTGVDFLKFKPQKSFVNKVFSNSFKNIKKQKKYSLVDLMDGQIIFDSARNLAVQLKIPLIACGLSKNQVENVFGKIGFEFLEEHEQNPFEENLHLKLSNIFSEDEMKFWFDRKKHAPQDLPRFILPLMVWNPSEKQIFDTVIGLGLLKKGRTAPLLTNNSMIPLIGMAEVNFFGYTSFEVEFSKDIREGKTPRTYWLNLFQILEYSSPKGGFASRTTKKVIMELGLSNCDIGLK